MAHSTDSEHRAALDLLLELSAVADTEAFARVAVSGLGTLISADLVAYNELDLDRERSFALMAPDHGWSPEVEAALGRDMRDNPLVTYHERTNDGQALRISDFITRRELHRRPLYDSVLKGLEIEYQMVATLPTSPTILVGLVFNRTHRDFTDHERALLETLRPHLVQAYEAVRDRSALRALETSLDAAGRAIVLLGAGGRIEYATPNARSLLVGYLGKSALAGEYLGDTLELSSGSLEAKRDGSRLIISRLDDQRNVLLLEERHVRLSESALGSLGLSPRETQVLAALGGGSTNSQIARTLGVSPRTVKKHLERIYDKLGTRTRAGAVSAAFAAARTGSDLAA
ncbi:MAG: response regulator transcription factor [Gaiellaceae bacterium]